MQALLSAATGDIVYLYKYNCVAGVANAARSDLTCNDGGAGVVLPSRKRGRDAEHEEHASSALLPIPGMHAPGSDFFARSHLFGSDSSIKNGSSFFGLLGRNYF